MSKAKRSPTKKPEPEPPKERVRKELVDALAAARANQEFVEDDFVTAVTAVPDVESALVRRALDIVVRRQDARYFHRILSKQSPIVTDLLPEIPSEFRLDMLAYFSGCDEGPLHEWFVGQMRKLLSETVLAETGENSRTHVEYRLRGICESNNTGPLILDLIEHGYIRSAMTSIRRFRTMTKQPFEMTPDHATRLAVTAARDCPDMLDQVCTVVSGFNRAEVIQALIVRRDSPQVLAKFVKPDDEGLDAVEMYLHSCDSADAIVVYAHKVFKTRDTGVLRMRLARLLCPTPEDIALEAVRRGQVPMQSPFGGFLPTRFVIDSIRSIGDD